MVIGGWLVDIDKNQLRNGDSVITLRNKVMAVLVYLAKNADRLVSRDELIDDIWLGNYPVGKKGLTNAVWQLRIDLQGIEQHSNEFQEDSILTVPKKGYQLLLPVITDNDSKKDDIQQSLSANIKTENQTEDCSDSPLANSDSNTNTNQLKKSEIKKPPPIVLFMAIFAITISTLAVYFGLMRGTGDPSQKQNNKDSVAAIFNTGNSSEQIRLKGTSLGSKLSPDGQHFAFNMTSNGQSDIYLQEVASQPLDQPASLQRLTDHFDPESSISFSSDGKQIAFVRGLGDSRCGVYVLDLQTSNSRLITPCNNTLFSRVAWTHNNQELLIFDRRPNQNIGGLYLQHINSGDRRLLPIPFSTRLYLEGEVKVSSDGTNLALVRSLAINAQDIFLFNFTHLRMSRLTYDNARIAGLAWMQDNQTLVFSSNRGKGFELWQQHIDAKLPASLNIRGKYPSYAVNANIALYEDVNGMESIVALELDGAESGYKSVIDPQVYTFEPIYSQQSNQLNYAKHINNQTQHWRWSFTDNSHMQHQFPNNLDHVTHVVTSPDKDFIAFIAHSSENDFRHIYRMSVADQQVIQVSKDAGDHFSPSWSSDGKSIYAATAITGRWEIWKYPIDGGTPVQVTKNGGGTIQHNQQYRFITKADGGGIWQLDEDNNEQLLISALDQEDWGNWSATADGIYYVERDSLQDNIMLFDYQTQSSTIIAKYTAETISKGKSLVFNPYNQTLYFTINLINDTQVMAVAEN